MNRENLAGKTKVELRAIAKTLNIKPHSNAKEETLIRQIMQQPQAYIAKAMTHKAEAPAKVAHMNTEEEVMQAIEEESSKEGFEVVFPQDGTWIFRCRGAEESGHMSTPLRIIKMKADSVSKGRRAPRALGNDRMFRGYADTILAG